MKQFVSVHLHTNLQFGYQLKIAKLKSHDNYVSWYKYLIVSLVFSHLGFWSGNLFLIAPFPDLCLLVPLHSIDPLQKHHLETVSNVKLQETSENVKESNDQEMSQLEINPLSKQEVGNKLN